MTVQKILLQATEKLSQAGIDTPRLDAEVLLAFVLNCRRLKLYIESEKILSAEQVERYKNLVERRAKKIPAAYLTGSKEFFGLNFAVTPDVLIPRPDTEILTQAAIEALQNIGGEIYFADLGTGSGAICVSVLKFLKTARAAATDISAKALEVAEYNAKKFGVDDRAEFFCGDLFQPLAGKIFHGVVSNPPYIATSDLAGLQAEVRTEPATALDGGADGLKFYRRIVEGAPNFLFSGGFLAMEVGLNQSAAVKNLLVENGNFGGVEILKDLAGIDRVVFARRI